MPSMDQPPRLKISARNQFEGIVTAWVPGPVNVSVSLALAGGHRLVAVISTGSLLSLGLAPGAQVTALVQAPGVTVVTGGGAPRCSTCNQWAGVISAVETGPVNAAVAIALPGGLVVHAVVTRDAVVDLGLAAGVPARALIMASQVVLAVRG